MPYLNANINLSSLHNDSSLEISPWSFSHPSIFPTHCEMTSPSVLPQHSLSRVAQPYFLICPFPLPRGKGFWPLPLLCLTQVLADMAWEDLKKDKTPKETVLNEKKDFNLRREMLSTKKSLGRSEWDTTPQSLDN